MVDEGHEEHILASTVLSNFQQAHEILESRLSSDVIGQRLAWNRFHREVR